MPNIIRAYVTVDGFLKLWTKLRISGAWQTDRTLFYDSAVNPPPAGDVSAIVNKLSAGAIVPELAAFQGVLPSLQGFGFCYVPSALGATQQVSTDLPDGLDFFTLSQGAWKYANAAWMIGSVVTNVHTGATALRVYRRELALGSLWVPQDVANEGSTGVDCRYNGVSNKIVTMVSADGFTYSVREFNMDTARWEDPRNPITFAHRANSRSLGLCVTQAGDIGYLVGGSDVNNLEQKILLATLFGGTWTTTILASTIPSGNPVQINSARPLQILSDPNGTRFHCFFRMTDSVTLLDYYFYQACDGGVLGTFNAFPVNSGIADGLGHGMILPGEDAGLVAYDEFDPIALTRTARAWFFTPLSAPVFTPETIEANHPEEQATCTFMTFDLATPVIACPVANTGVVGTLYTGTLVIAGGVAPFTFAIVAGALPPGIILNAATGVIAGIPTTPGTYSYTARVTDSLGATADSPNCPLIITGLAPVPQSKCYVNLGVSDNPVDVNTAVTLLALLAPHLAGTIQFFADGTLIGTSAIDNDQAILTISLSAGTHILTANYTGNPGPVCNSCPLTLVVTPDSNAANLPPALQLTSDNNPVDANQPLTLIAILSSSLVGSIVFYADGAIIGTMPVTDDRAVLKTSLAAGTRFLMAKYMGASLPLTSNTLKQFVTPDVTPDLSLL